MSVRLVTFDPVFCETHVPENVLRCVVIADGQNDYLNNDDDLNYNRNNLYIKLKVMNTIIILMITVILMILINNYLV